MTRLLIVWLINALALLAVSYLIPSVQVASFGAALVAALVLGLVNAVIRPLLILLTLPVTILTLGLFIFVINALMLMLVSLIPQLGFSVENFLWALIGSILISLVSGVLSKVVK